MSHAQPRITSGSRTTSAVPATLPGTISTRSVETLELIPCEPSVGVDGRIYRSMRLVHPKELGDDECMSIDLDELDDDAGVTVERLIAAEAKRVSEIYASLAAEMERKAENGG